MNDGQEVRETCLTLTSSGTLWCIKLSKYLWNVFNFKENWNYLQSFSQGNQVIKHVIDEILIQY